MKKIGLLLFVIAIYSFSIFAQTYDSDDGYEEMIKKPIIYELPFCLEGNISIFPPPDSLPQNMTGYVLTAIKINRKGEALNFAIKEADIEETDGYNNIKYIPANWTQFLNNNSQKDSMPAYMRYYFNDIKRAAASLQIFKNSKTFVKDTNYAEIKLYINRQEELLYQTYVNPEPPVYGYGIESGLDVDYGDPDEPFSVEGQKYITVPSGILPSYMEGYASIYLRINKEGELMDFIISCIRLSDRGYGSDNNEANFCCEYEDHDKMLNDGLPVKPEDIPLYVRDYYEPVCNAVKALKIVRNKDVECNEDYILYTYIDINY